VARMARISVRSGSLNRSVADRFRSTIRFERTHSHWRERPPRVDKLGVTGSSPVPPTSQKPRYRQVFPLFRPD
jgi:hypothetical protein